jgi:hypothetical protein
MDEPPPSTPPARQGASWVAMVASGLIGGAVVALAAGLYGYLASQGSDDGATNVLLARLGAVELVVQDLNARAPASAPEPQAATGFAERLAKVEAALAAAPGPGARDSSSGPASDPALAPRLDAVEASAKSLADALARLERRADESAAALQDARERGGATPAPSEPPSVAKSDFDTLSSRVDGLQRALSQSTGSLQSSLSETASSLQQALERQSMSVMDRAVRLALVTSGIKSAVTRSAPYAGELNAAKALGADPQAIAALEPFAASGAPSTETLGRELAALAPNLTPPESRPPPDSGYLDRLQAHADRLVRIRPAGGAAGEDFGAVVDRIEAKAKQGDIAGALAELRKLPDAARAPAAAWINKAEARQAAVAAAQRIETSALAALSNQ